MDSDGYVDVFGRCEFVNMREELSNAVASWRRASDCGR